MTRVAVEKALRPVVMDHYEGEPTQDMSKKKKTQSKPKPPQVVPKNQQTLFGFMKKN